MRQGEAGREVGRQGETEGVRYEVVGGEEKKEAGREI